MLVLTRRIGEQVLIDNGVIQMKVLKADNGIISIGFKAPDHIAIDREEIHVKKVLQQKQGVFSKGGSL